MPNFIPVIRKDKEAESARASERIVVSAMRDALGYERVAQEVGIYKADGKITGHTVLDDDAAVRGLLKLSPEHLRSAITAQNVKPYRLTQLLNRVLRAEFEMVRGKLTGNPSPKKLAKQQQQQLQQQQPQPTEAEAEVEAPAAE